MKIIALLTALFELIDRGLDKLDEFDAQRKLLRRQERRASVQDNPDKAFADLFGKPGNIQLHKPINREALNSPVRSDLPTDSVDKNGERLGSNA